MLRRLAALLAAAGSVGASIAFDAFTYDQMVLMVNDADCVFPSNYTISNFTAYTPTDANSTQTVIKFKFADNSTAVTTSCERNSTSKSTAKPGLAPRYSCEDPLVQFIWQNATLSMVEGVCPGIDGNTQLEAAGQEDLTLDCHLSPCGNGTLCSVPDFSGKFVSLQPTPRS